MNILFLTLSHIRDLNEHDIYQDLCREFSETNHRVYVVTPALPGDETLSESCGCVILSVRIGKQAGCSLIEKGISTLLMPQYYAVAIKKYLKGIKFDLILYSTPPITLLPVIRSLKKQHRCRTYLMLKDIFPQNAVDLEMFGKRSPIYYWFRHQEKALYAVSDTIGCMSRANMEYLRTHNKLGKTHVEICPNALQARTITPLLEEEKHLLRQIYGIPECVKVLVYGGNLGAPQGVDYLIKCLGTVSDDTRIFFLIIGDGSAYGCLDRYIQEKQLKNVLLIKRLPREEYFRLMRLGDVGMVFLDPRFTIPNFPSRILPYMEYSMPIACVTDRATDIGTIARDNGFGWYVPSDDPSAFRDMIDHICSADLSAMGILARAYLETHFDTKTCCRRILDTVSLEDCHA